MSAESGKYEIGERIGGGGMADVFHGVVRGAEGFERKVAVKRIKRNISTDKGFAKLFIDEARLAAKLMHPNIVQTVDFDRDKTGCFYLVMELIEGVDLRELVKSGRVPVSAVVFIISEVLRALDYAHEMVADGRPLTIVHRDISPHNIMLSWQGSVKVVDFGIAKAIEGSLVSRSGSLKGKVAYMSPEQVHGQALDGRSDLFAVGIILHELLSGQRLFMAQTEAATLSQVLTKPIASPRTLNDQVPADLDAVVMKLLERDRDQRFERARDAVDALSACAVSGGRGRSDLETVLGERFPGRGPQRVRHLSTSPQPMMDPSRSASAIPESIGGATAMAETLAATPKAKTPAPTLPKRTVTAMPARTEGGPAQAGGPGHGGGLALASTVESVSSSSPSSRSKMPWIAAAILVLGLAAASYFFLIADPESGSVPTGVEVVAVQGGSELLGTKSDASPLGLPASSPDAGGGPTTLPYDGGSGPEASVAADANSPEVVTARPENTKEGDRVPKAAKKAKLTIRVRPWASISIDGKNYGQTPQTIELDRGKHRIVLTNDGLDRVERLSVTLKAAQVKSIEKDWTEQ